MDIQENQSFTLPLFLCIIEVMKRYAHPRETLIFVVIAVIFMVVLDVFILKGDRPYLPERGSSEEQKSSHVVIDSMHVTHMEPAAGNPLEDLKTMMPDVAPEEEVVDLPFPEPIMNQALVPSMVEKVKQALARPKQSRPVEDKPVVKQSHKDAKIAIIIDDMGMTRHDKDVLKLKAPLTLAYLPYAEGLEGKTKKASKRGHELMLHMPMEPLNAKLDLGPDPLKTQMKKDEFTETLEAALDSFDGFVGVNNHMGSKLTQDPQAMIWLMQALKARDLYFIDSKTIKTSLAGQMAYSFDLPYEERDVFLDHYPDYESVKAALKQLENVARHKGSAIAIGHPKPNTVKALKEWIPTLKDKNIELVKASALIKTPSAMKLAQVQKKASLAQSHPPRPE